MTGAPKLLAFHVDYAVQYCLEQAFPGWEIEAAPAASLAERDAAPAEASLLVVASSERAATIALCRFLRRQNCWRATPLLVLVPPALPELVRDVLEAGASGCLVLPVHHKEVSSMLARTQKGNQPGRHTLDLDQAQTEDPWRDDGGQG